MNKRPLKKRVFVVALIAILIAITAAGSLAYYTAEERAHNVITTGGVSIELHEWADEDKTESFPANGVSDVTPGLSVIKIAEVENIGSGEAWIRMQVEVSVTAADGSTQLPTDMVELDFDLENWTKGDDGYWYYNASLKDGEITKPLFTSVTFATKMGNEYQESKCTVDVLAQAVQTANNGDSATEAAGWPA